ncbi:MAG TPA: SHOCT domain-containing protein [Myxococcota bacterium]
MIFRIVQSRVSIGLWGVVAAGPTYAQSMGDHLERWHGDWGWGHMVFGSLMMLLFWGAVVLAVVLVVRFLGGSAHRSDSADSQNRALAILEERFARGEIDKDEFEERKRLLSR